MTATIKNADRLLRKLKVLPRIARERVKAAMAQSADEMVEMMERLVPQDEGDLFASIGWVWGSNAPKGSVAIGGLSEREDGKGLNITIFAGSEDAFYVRWVEFGTTKMAARPFFFVSYRAGRKPFKRRIQTAIGKAARQVASSS